MSCLRIATLIMLLASGCNLLGKKKADAGPTTTTTDGPFGYRVNAGHTGAMDGTLQAPLQKRWVAKLGGTVSYPIVTSKGVFVVEAGTHVQLRAFDVASGSALWPAVLLDSSDSIVRAAYLAYENGRLFTLNDRGLVTAVDAETGAVLWRTPLTDVGAQFSWPLTAAGGRLFVPAFGLSGTTSALLQDGTYLWTTTTGNSDASPAVGGGRVYTAYKCASGSGYDFTSGSLAWTSNGACSQTGLPFVAFDDDVVYVGTAVGDHSIGARLDRDGNTLNAIQSRVPVTVHDGRFITMVATQEHTLRSLNSAGGSTIWTDTDADDVLGPPIIVNGQVFSAAADGTVRALDEATGAVLWTDNVGAGIHLGRSATVWGDLGSNGDVLVVPTLEGLTVYETDPAGTVTPDESYKTYCETMGAAFHIEGTTSRRSAGGTKLNDGSSQFDGAETLTANTLVNADWTTLSNPTDFQTITISTSSGDMPNWSLEFATRNALQPLTVMAYPKANTRSSYDDLSLGVGKLMVKRTDPTNTVFCTDGDAQFDIVGMTASGAAGLLSMKGSFVYHCNREAAPVRGCFDFHR